MATRIDKLTRDYPAMTPELFEALSVLTGFAESELDKGSAYAPIEHARIARQVIRATLDAWDIAGGRKAWRVRLARAARCGRDEHGPTVDELTRVAGRMADTGR